jgi:hypothetical protein
MCQPLIEECAILGILIGQIVSQESFAKAGQFREVITRKMRFSDCSLMLFNKNADFVAIINV